MKCSRCGRELDLGAVFCGNCGQAVLVGEAEDAGRSQTVQPGAAQEAEGAGSAAQSQPYDLPPPSKARLNKLANWAVACGVVGVPAIIILIGLPLCLAAIIMGVRVYKISPIRSAVAIVLGVCGLVLFGLLLSDALKNMPVGDSSS